MDAMGSGAARRYPAGAELGDGGVHFRVWAPDHPRVALIVEGRQPVPLEKEPDGYFSAFVPGLAAGARYRYRLGDGEALPDPASRFQPEGVDGPSEVVDPRSFQWTDAGWPGVRRERQVLYELHVGTFTAEGDWAAATERLDRLKDVGITVIELMPVNEFCGTFGWGYDGVLIYAPTRLYGRPDDFRRFVDRAHALGIGVILDVVYNHFGPGELCSRFTERYFSEGPANDWGRAMNFDGPHSEPVRDYFARNAACWIEEYHLDGLRIDATQALDDDSEEHIIARIAREGRAAAPGRAVYLVSENEPQDSRQVRPRERGGYDLDSLWNDDFHHAAMVALTGHSEAYYHDHRSGPQEFIAAAKYGYLFQGQRYDWQKFVRGTPSLDLGPSHFVNFIQNHDQVANSARGYRADRLAAPAQLRAITALLLLSPQTPMLFQGQEFGASTPFFYFYDQQGEIGASVRKGRADFLQQFPSIRSAEVLDQLADPSSRETFERSKLDWTEFEKHAGIVALHRDLLALRRTDPTFSRGCGRGEIDGSVLAADAFFLRFFGEDPAEDRLLFVNLGRDLPVLSIPDPLSAPPAARDWSMIWSSELTRYGGTGQRPVDLRERWTLPAHAAIVFATKAKEARDPPSQEETKRWQAGQIESG